MNGQITLRKGLIDGLMCYWDSGRALGALADSLRPRSRAATRLSHLFAFNGEASLRALYYARRSDQDWVNRYRIEPGLLRAARDDTSFSLEFREDNLAALGRIRRLARERGVPVRLVITPYLPAYAAHMRDSGPWLERIHATGDRKERLWDYRNAEPDSRHFADRVHVNDQGSIPFAARLVRDGFFSDPAR